jgi:phosphate transport system substrate-binding protein
MVYSSVEIKQKIIHSILDFATHVDKHKQSGQYSLNQISEILALAIEVNNLINALDKDLSNSNIKVPDLSSTELIKLKRVLELFFKYKSDLNSISIDIGENLSSSNRYLQKGIDFILQNLSSKDYRQQLTSKPSKAKTKPKLRIQDDIPKAKPQGLGLVAPLMFLVLVIVAGFTVYNFFFDKSATRVATLVKEYRSDRELSSIQRTKLGKELEIFGTNSLLNLLRDNQNLFKAKYPEISLNVQGGDSSDAVDQIIDGRINLAASSKLPSADDRKRAIKEGRPIVDHKVALDSVVVFVNKSNPIDVISVDQLKQIYSGQIKEWRQVDYSGYQYPINKFCLSKQSGTYAFFMDRVMFMQPINSEVIHVYNPIQMIDLVAADPDAIGFASLSAVKGSNLVKVLKVSSIFDESGTSPLASNNEINVDVIKRGEYPLTRYLYLVTAGQIADEVAKVIDFMRSPSAQSKLADYGLVGII